MTNADEIIDRRRLRRKLSFWRIATFGVLGIALIGLILVAARDQLLSGAKNEHIARVKITGVITNDQPMLSLLEKLKDNEKVSAVVLNISSPGGSTVGGEAMYEAVRNLAEEKPVVSTVGTLAASAGYMVASGTDHIVARRSSIVGSIGVLFQYADASELLDKIGVKVNAVKSSPLKAEPSPFNPASQETIDMIDRGNPGFI
ncbi:MAG: S49 family peptidase [Pseudomonadota bacterium]